MALIEYDVYKQKLRDLEPELKKLGDALDIDAVAQEAARLEDETTQDGFWNNLERSQKVQTRLKQLQNKLHRFKKLMSTWEDLTTFPVVPSDLLRFFVQSFKICEILK